MQIFGLDSINGVAGKSDARVLQIKMESRDDLDPHLQAMELSPGKPPNRDDNFYDNHSGVVTISNNVKELLFVA